MTISARLAAFGAFFRRYARTWQHAVAAAAMTAFGTLTVVDERFALVGLLAYVCPPMVLYVHQPADAATESAARSPADGSATNGATEVEPTTDEAAATDDDAGTADPADSSAVVDEPRWTTATTPTDETLTDATVAEGAAYAVGEAGSLLCDDGDGWHVAVADGPDAQSTALRGVDSTADGIWFAGDSGVVGRYDHESGRHVSHSEPDGDTTNILALAAAGDAEAETVLLADGSGRLRRGRYRDGDLAWDAPVTPASGSSLSGVDLPTPAVGYACDTNQTVVRTTDGGRSFDRVGLDAGGTLTDVAAVEPDRCLAADDAGVVYRYDGDRWTPERVDDGTLWAVAVDDERAVACGPDGTVFERGRASDEWTRLATPAAGDLRGVAVGAARAVAVGTDGAVVERSGGGR